MITIKEAVEKALEIEDQNNNKHDLARKIGVEPIMIHHYIKGNTRVPQIRVAKQFYKRYGFVVMPYVEEELRDG